MGFLKKLHEITKYVAPVEHVLMDNAHDSSTKLVGETSHGIGNLFGDTALGRAGKHWDDMADRDNADFERWLSNTGRSALAVYAAMSAGGAGASGGAGSGSGAGAGAGGAAGEGSFGVLASDGAAGVGSEVGSTGVFASDATGAGLGSTAGQGAGATAASTGSKTTPSIWNKLGNQATNTAISQAVKSAIEAGNQPGEEYTEAPPNQYAPGQLPNGGNRVYKRFTPTGDVETVPFSAVNPDDASAALFGKGKQHLYYQPPGMADGGSVDDWSDIGFYDGGDTLAPSAGESDGSSLADWLGLALGGGRNDGEGGASPLADAAPAATAALAGPTAQDDNYGYVPSAQAGPYAGLMGSAKGMATDAGGWLSRLANGDQKAGRQAQMGLTALGMLNSLRQKKKKAPSAAEMQAQLKSPYSMWTPGQQDNFNRYFYQTPVTKTPMPRNPFMAAGGSLGLVAGNSGGQDDDVTINVSPGEYVFDAESVAALGDGNNAAGAQKLDQMRESLRAHKRGADTSTIAPKARSPLDYLEGAQ